MLATPVARLRVVAFLEGVSFLVLLGVAMPLKYIAGLPLAVRVVGSAHGLFFVLFVLAVAETALALRWSWKTVLGALVASVVPFGTFVLDARLRRQATDATLAGTEAA